MDYINKERIINNFIEIAKINSGSDDENAEKQIPSTECQKEMALYLKNKLLNIGLKEVELSENYIVTATLDSNSKTSVVIGLLAHYDTNFDAPNKNVKPILHDYKTGDIELKNSVIISSKELKPYQNSQIITSDGTTLLGADDKAGVAEIIEAMEILLNNPTIKHPKIRIAFTPDEETGMGIKKFNIKSFGANVAYTIDGDLPNIIENESFNAFNPEILIKGKNVHCGYAKTGGMINSIKVANWIANKLPKNECPEKTEKKQGYFHINSINGSVEETKIKMLVRDHDINCANERIKLLEKIIEQASRKFKCIISFDKKESYHNMREAIDNYPEVMIYACEGLKRSGLIPKTVAIRGGTDGSLLSELGLPTPNLGAGGINFHSVNEFLPVNNMIKSVENIINILSVWAEKTSN